MLKKPKPKPHPVFHGFALLFQQREAELAFAHHSVAGMVSFAPALVLCLSSIIIWLHWKAAPFVIATLSLGFASAVVEGFFRRGWGVGCFMSGRHALHGTVDAACISFILIIKVCYWQSGILMQMEGCGELVPQIYTWHVLCTCLGLVLPIRWLAFIPLVGVMLVGTSAIAMMYGCMDAYTNMCSGISPMVGTTLIVLISKFTQERSQRRHFQIAYMSQRKDPGLQYEQRRPVEHLPAQTIGTQEQDTLNMPEDARSSLSMTSNPETSEIGHMFKEVHNPDSKQSLTQQLEQIAGIGRHQKWLVESKDLTVDSSHVLGAGAFGMVLSGLLHKTPVAVKVAKKTALSSETARLTDLSNELRVLRLLHHPNIVMLAGACVEPQLGEIAIVLEMVQGDDLGSFLQNARPQPSDTDRFSLLVGITRALCYLHAQAPRVIHGDLKCSNVKVERMLDFPRPILLDFGLARLITKRVKPLGGTLLFMAPEVAMRSSPPSCASDIYSLGRLAFFIISGQRPNDGMCKDEYTVLLKVAILPALVWPECGVLAVQLKHFFRNMHTSRAKV